MIKFGMTVAEMIAQLTRGFTKQTGRIPSGLEKIKIQQEAIQRAKDMNKVLDMKGNPIDPAKPIMGGEQSKNLSGEITSVPSQPGQSGLSYETKNKEAIQRLKDKMKKDPPEELAYGGVAGLLGERTNYRYGGDTMGGKNDKSKTSSGPDRSRVSTQQESNHQNRNDRPDYSQAKQLARTMAYNTAKNVGSKKLAGVLGLSQYANPIGQFMAVKALYNKMKNPNINEEEETSGIAGATYADGGRAGFAGGGMGRRGFLKLLAGAGAGITALKSGFIGMGKKAAPIKKVAETAAGSSGPPPYFFKLVEKIKMLGDDAPGLATLDRQKVTKYKDYSLTEDVSTGELWIQKNHPDYIDDVTPYQLNQETYMNYKPGENIIGKNNKPIKTADEYVEDTTYTKQDGEIYQVDDGVPEDVVEEVMEEALKPGFNQGGRAGYAAGKGVTSLLNLIKKKFGKDSITTADKIPTPRATLDRDMFKKFDDRNPDQNRLLTDAEIEDYEMELGDSETWMMDGTVGEAEEALIEQKRYMADMELEYKKGNLDPVAGDKSPARKRFLEKKLEEMEASGDSRLMTREEIEELTFFDLGTEMDKTKLSVNDEIKQGVAEIMSDTSPAALQKSIEIDNLMLKYPGISKDFADQIASSSPTMKADMIAMVEQAFKMDQIGMSGDEIIDAFKKGTDRTKQADGGRIGYAAGGGIMKIINKLKKLGKPKKKKLETVKDFVDRREFLKKSVGNSEKNKNKRMMDDIKRAVEDVRKNPEFKFKEIDIEKEIQPILNKGRKLHATGGIASMLGE